MTAASSTAAAVSPPTSSCPTTRSRLRSRHWLGRWRRSSQEVYVTLYAFALDLSHHLARGFKYQPAWRADFIRQLTAKGVDISPKLYAAAPRYLDRLIEDRVSRFVEGDSTAKRRALSYDAPLDRAMQLMDKARTQQDLFRVADVSPSTTPSRRP